jgi:hypothetical protein
MDQDDLLTFRGLSDAEETACRLALESFEKGHELAGWALMVQKRETTPEKYHVKIVIHVPSESASSGGWKDIAGADATFDVAAELGKMLEGVYRKLRPNE